jgi:hypothetical protein
MWGQELPDFVLQDAQFDVNARVRQKPKSPTVVSRIRVDDANEHRTDSETYQSRCARRSTTLERARFQSHER